MVALEQTTKSLAHDDFARARVFRITDYLIADSLMRPVQVAMGGELVDRSLE